MATARDVTAKYLFLMYAAKAQLHQSRDYMDREFTVVVERGEDGFYVASVPQLPGCHTEARSLDELMERAKEAIALYVEPDDEIGV
jgi:predicted RNase H-like HicB family nuclease